MKWLLASAAVVVLSACGTSASDTSSASAVIATPTAAPSTSAATTAAPSAAPTPAAVAVLHCGDVGGVFVPHGTDGRGDCEPLDNRAKCHVPPAQEDADYLADLILNPPFADGVVQHAELINLASNKDCWKAPPG